MPDALDTAVQALTAEGVAPDVARRAAVAALWRETGRLPSPGVEAPVDLLPLAREFVALAEAQEVATMQATGPLEDLATFAEEDAPAAGSLPRILREAHLLHPGTFNGHTFTRADLAEVVANFDPQDPPPIQLDHSLSARDTQGYVRALRMDGDKLRALLEFRGQEAESKVADGLWRKLSAGIYLKPKRRLKEGSQTARELNLTRMRGRPGSRARPPAKAAGHGVRSRAGALEADQEPRVAEQEIPFPPVAYLPRRG